MKLLLLIPVLAIASCMRHAPPATAAVPATPDTPNKDMMTIVDKAPLTKTRGIPATDLTTENFSVTLSLGQDSVCWYVESRKVFHCKDKEGYVWIPRDEAPH